MFVSSILNIPIRYFHQNYLSIPYVNLLAVFFTYVVFITPMLYGHACCITRNAVFFRLKLHVCPQCRVRILYFLARNKNVIVSNSCVVVK